MSNKNDKILKICFQRLKYFRYSDRTIEIYIHYIEKFLIQINKYHQHIVSDDFQSYLDNFIFSSTSQQNQIISSIKFLYEKVLNKKYNKINFKRPKKRKILPRIIDKNHLINSIEKINNIKHKAILKLTYCCGIRVSEVINLKIIDIDSKRMIINIKNAKGFKDRIVPLSNNTLETLREYYKKEKPITYLFNGQSKLQYSSTSCNKLVKKYIGEEYHMHLIRHSSFTHLLENGTDLRIIQKIAGHSSSKTTEIYTHVSTELLNKIELPI